MRKMGVKDGRGGVKNAEYAIKKKRRFKQLMALPLVEIIFFRSASVLVNSWLRADLQCRQTELNCSVL